MAGLVPTPLGVDTPDHRPDRRPAARARHPIIGTRAARDAIHHTDHELITCKDGTARRYPHRDGTEMGRKP